MSSLNRETSPCKDNLLTLEINDELYLAFVDSDSHQKFMCDWERSPAFQFRQHRVGMEQTYAIVSSILHKAQHALIPSSSIPNSPALPTRAEECLVV